MTPPEELSALKSCPFCHSKPHHGLRKVEYDQLHGEPFQRYRIWCPRGHAEIVGADQTLAFAEWNTRAPSIGDADKQADRDDPICVRCASQQEGPVPTVCTCGDADKQADDHARGCQGREYTCTCGYDERVAAALIQLRHRVTEVETEWYGAFTARVVAEHGTTIDILSNRLNEYAERIAAVERERSRLATRINLTDVKLADAESALAASEEQASKAGGGEPYATIVIERRGDGGLRVSSPDALGLVLSSPDPDKLGPDIISALRHIRPDLFECAL